MDNSIELAPCIYFSSSDEGIILEVNNKLCSSLGYTRQEVINQKTELIFTVPTRIFQQTHFFPLLKMQGHAEEIFISLCHKDGSEIPLLINAERKIINGQPVNVYAGIIVNNRKKFENELIAAKKLAEKAVEENTVLIETRAQLQKHTEDLDEKIQLINKHNEELKEFNRVVTHDLQEPLRKLSVFSNMLIEEEQIAKQRNIAAKVHRVTDQMRNVIFGLQQYVWLTEATLKLETIDLEKLLPVLWKRIEKEFPGVIVSCTIENNRQFPGDPDQIAMLFYQLLNNAVRFRTEDNKAYIIIRLDTLQLNKFRNIEGRYKYVEFIRIEVSDKGKGFNAQFSDQAFMLFKRLHIESGSGVGLALCKRIVDNHHGTIMIRSNQGKDTTVTVQLPFHEREIEETEKHHKPLISSKPQTYE